MQKKGESHRTNMKVLPSTTSDPFENSKGAMSLCLHWCAQAFVKHGARFFCVTSGGVLPIG